jgi:hypothetical protein
MLARFLRRSSPARYALHTAESLRSVPFGLRVKSLVHGLPGAMDDAAPALEHHLGRHMPVAQQLTHDFLQGGHPDHLGVLLDLLHGEHDVPGPLLPQHGGRRSYGPAAHSAPSRLDPLVSLLHHLNAAQEHAATDPNHYLRLFTPEQLQDEQYNVDHIPLQHPSALLRSLHPYHGGPGIMGVPDLLSRRPLRKDVAPVYSNLHNLLFTVYGDLFNQSQRARG